MINSIESTYLIDEIFRAQEKLSKTDLILPTEIVSANDLRSNEQDNLWLAGEIHQSIGAYKIRGAANAIIRLAENERSISLVTASAGNHAQAVALMARELNFPATIVMPANTPDFKVKKVESLSSKKTHVVLEGDTYDDAEVYANYLANRSELNMIHPFNDLSVIAGQGTWGLEVLKSLSQIDNIYVPVGGGGLLAGISSVIKKIRPKIRIVAVEPSGAASLKEAFINGEPTKLNSIDTFVDGASVKIIGELPFSIFKDKVDQIITVDNLETIDATRRLNIKYSPRMVEFAGALSLAGYLKDSEREAGQTSICLITGGNLSVERYMKYC